MRKYGTTRVGALALLALGASTAMAGTDQQADSDRCENLAKSMQGRWPDAATRMVSATWRPPGPFVAAAMPGAPPPAPLQLPEHCEVLGIMHERTGIDGQHYAIHFHLRLPTRWNGKFFFQGGGGSNGVIGDALGPTAMDAPPALLQGYAVVSQDSGHDNTTNSDPHRGGAVAFGFDPQARADYGHASLKVVADAAKSVLNVYYGRVPRYSYFVGCSKGGQEGMEFAQRFPEEFDGIVAAAPGFSLPRAAVAEAWDVQSIAAIDRVPSAAPPAAPAGATPATTAPAPSGFERFADSFSGADLALVGNAILGVCDADDGAKDGIINDIKRCTTARVHPALEALACTAAKTERCLLRAQIVALERIIAGPRDAAGHALYADWQWDAGIASPGWRIWKLGSSDHRVPALNIVLGGTSLGTVFTTPPTAMDAAPPAAAAYELGFSFDHDAPQIYATDKDFAHSAWDDVGARSSDLARFRDHGAKLIVPHGVSDPVFSIHDTLAWYDEVNAQNHGQAQRFVRVFPVPGMNHCGGGPATDHYDAFSALTAWVEKGEAPERILATAGPTSPWPGRQRPLCVFPKTAQYKGQGSLDEASNFVCR